MSQAAGMLHANKVPLVAAPSSASRGRPSVIQHAPHMQAASPARSPAPWPVTRAGVAQSFVCSSSMGAAATLSPPVPFGAPFSNLTPAGSFHNAGSPVSSVRIAGRSGQAQSYASSPSRAKVRTSSYTPSNHGSSQASSQRANVPITLVSSTSSVQQCQSGFSVPMILGSEAMGTRSSAAVAQRAPPEEDKKCSDGVEVEINEYKFRCISVLGRGSYSEVWRAEVVAGASAHTEVALKEVRCGSQAELQQAIFEVQVLLALERSAAQHQAQLLRVPQCISYKVDACEGGWKVKTAMTVVPGESLDYFIRRPVSKGFTRSAAIRRASALAVKLIRDIGPMLQMLAPIAWHRDVNSHNILVDDKPDELGQDIAKNASFWLIDFGLAVDSQSWVTAQGKWRTEYIGGDSRYWPPSSWIMHLLGPEGFQGQDALCEQYQRRLDIHGLGITALELFCAVILASPPSEQDQRCAFEPVLDSWERYRDDVWRWWSAVYQVFSTGGDIAPVQAQLVQDRIIEQLLVLLDSIRRALRQCAGQLVGDDKTGRLLLTIADMLDEGQSFGLADLYGMLGEAPSQAAAALPFGTARAAPRQRSPPPRRSLVQQQEHQAEASPSRPSRQLVHEIHSPYSPYSPAALRTTSPVTILSPQKALSVGAPSSASPGAVGYNSCVAQPRRAPSLTSSLRTDQQAVAIRALSPDRVRQDARLGRSVSPSRAQTPQMPVYNPRTSLTPSVRVHQAHPWPVSDPRTAATLPAASLGSLQRSPSSAEQTWEAFARSPRGSNGGFPAGLNVTAASLRSPAQPGSPAAAMQGSVASSRGIGQSNIPSPTVGAGMAAAPPPSTSVNRHFAEAYAAVLRGTSPAGADRVAGTPNVAPPDQMLIGGDGDVGAGPAYPTLHASLHGDDKMTTSGDITQEALRARIRSLEASSDEHEKLRERIKSLEDSLQKLGRESLERAKVGMEKLAEKYFPKVKQYEALGIATPPISMVEAQMMQANLCPYVSSVPIQGSTPQAVGTNGSGVRNYATLNTGSY